MATKSVNGKARFTFEQLQEVERAAENRVLKSIERSEGTLGGGHNATIAMLRDELETAHVTLSHLAALAHAIERDADARMADGTPAACFAGLQSIAQLAEVTQFVAEHGANMADVALEKTA